MCDRPLVMSRLLCHAHHHHHSSPCQTRSYSFSTAGPVTKTPTQLPLNNLLSVFFTGSPDWPYTGLSKRVNLPQFYQGERTGEVCPQKILQHFPSAGARTAIEVVSRGIGRRNISMLDNLVETECKHKANPGALSLFFQSKISIIRTMIELKDVSSCLVLSKLFLDCTKLERHCH